MRERFSSNHWSEEIRQVTRELILLVSTLGANLWHARLELTFSLQLSFLFK